MKRGIKLVLVLSLVIISLGFSSAGWFSDFFGKVTGNVVSENNKVLSLPGGNTNHYVEVPSFNIDYSQGFSIEAWVKPTGYYSPNGENPTGPIVIISKGQIGNNWEYILGIQNDGKLYLGETRTSIKTCNSVIKLNEWQHVAVTIDRSNNVKFYVNGVQASSCGSISFKFSSTNQVTQIGRGSNWASASWFYDGFKGSMDEVRLWSKVLSNDEIKQSMQTSISSPKQSLIASWTFNEGNAKDFSGNNRNGQLKGSSSIVTDNFLSFSTTVQTINSPQSSQNTQLPLCEQIRKPQQHEITSQVGDIKLVRHGGAESYEPSYMASANWLMFHNGDYVELEGEGLVLIRFENECSHQAKNGWCGGVAFPNYQQHHYPSFTGDISYLGEYPAREGYWPHFWPNSQTDGKLFCISGKGKIQNNNGDGTSYNLMLYAMTDSCVQNVTSYNPTAFAGGEKKEQIAKTCIDRYDKLISALRIQSTPINQENCSKIIGSTTLTADNNTMGFKQYADPRFLCYNGIYYDCGWDLSIPSFATKSQDQSTLGNWKCNLNERKWQDLSQQQTTVNNEPVQNIVNSADSFSGGFESTLNPSPQVEAVPYVVPQQPNNTIVHQTQSNTSQTNSTQNTTDNINNQTQIKNVEVEKDFGKITFNSVNISEISESEIGNYIEVSKSKIKVDSKRMPKLNKSATLIFTYVNVENPKVLVDGKDCNYCKIIEHNKYLETVKVEVPHFTTYEIVEDDSISIGSNKLEQEVEKNSNSSGIWLPLTLIIILLLGAILFFFFYLKKTDKPEEKPVEVKNTISPVFNKLNYPRRYRR